MSTMQIRDPAFLRRSLMLGALAVNLLFLVVSSYFLYHSRQHYLEKTRQNASNLSRVLERSVSSEFEKIDNTLLALSDEISHQYDEGDLNPARLEIMLHQHMARLPELAGIRIVDQQGMIAFGLGPHPPVRPNVADRDYFQHFAASDSPKLFISQPVISRVQGDWQIILAHRLNDNKGRFAGVVIAGVRLDWLTRQISTLDVGKQGFITLRDPDLRIVTRYPLAAHPSRRIGSAVVNPVFRQALADSPNEGIVEVASPADNKMRLAAYRRLGNTAHLIVVALALEDALALWWIEAGVALLALVLLLLISWLGSRQLLRLWGQAHLYQERLDMALGSTRQAWFHYDVPTGQVEVSPEYPRMLGYDPENFATTVDKWQAHIHPDDLSTVQFAYKAAFSTGVTAPMEYRRQHHDGGWVWLSTVGRVVAWDSDGKPLKITGIHTDISERRAAEAELRAYRNYLEQLVAARTQELSEAKQAAEAANISKTAFLANMSHEIRTPLNAITGMGYLIRRGGLSPRQQEQMDKLEAAGNHLLNIINAILELTKIDAGKLVLEQEPLRPAEILEKTRLMLQDKADEKGLRLTCITATETGCLLGDPTRLRQALLNYAANAVKFTDHGGVTLRCDVESEDETSVLLRFSVRDSGIGIDPARLEKLFAAFEQADNSITRQYGGTGLGLAITRKLAEQMAGSAGAYSEPGVGSTFWFTARLPKAPDSTCHTEDTPAQLQDAEQQLLQHAKGKRLLLVEDEPVNREIIIDLLTETGLHVDEAENGSLALDCLMENSYDLILMDMQMPVLDGLSATRQLRRLPHGLRVPVIALTANAFAEDRERCFAAGMNDFLAKPVAPQLLFACLAKWLVPPAQGNTQPTTTQQTTVTAP